MDGSKGGRGRRGGGRGRKEEEVVDLEEGGRGGK
jgi:hypothetical protein